MKEFSHYITQLYKYAGKILYINLFGMIIVSFLDGMGILLLILMLNISGILNDSAMSSMWGIFHFSKDSSADIGLSLILAIYIILVIVQNLLSQNITIRDVKIHQGFMNHLKEETYLSLLHVKWAFYLKTRKSNIINSLTKDINRVGIGIKMFMQLLTNLIFTLIQIGIAFWLAAEVTSLVLICGLGLAVFSWKFVKQAKTLGKETTQLSRQYLAGITDNLNGIKDIKTNMLEKSRIKWLESLNKKILNEQVNYVKLQTNSQLSYKTALAIIITCFIFLSVNFIHTSPDKLLLVILIFSRLWPRFVDIQLNIQQLAASTPAFKILLDLQNETNAFRETVYGNDNINPIYIENMIECRNLSFRYNSD